MNELRDFRLALSEAISSRNEFASARCGVFGDAYPGIESHLQILDNDIKMLMWAIGRLAFVLDTQLSPNTDGSR